MCYGGLKLISMLVIDKNKLNIIYCPDSFERNFAK